MHRGILNIQQLKGLTVGVQSESNFSNPDTTQVKCLLGCIRFYVLYHLHLLDPLTTMFKMEQFTFSSVCLAVGFVAPIIIFLFFLS